MGNSQEHVRFETSVLTLKSREGYDASMQLYRGRFRASGFNMACLAGITRRGWDLPDKPGSKIVLVFTTEPTEGASVLRDGVADLHYAGHAAWAALPFRKSSLCFQQGRPGKPRPLYWWPEIVG